ncbi:uncharacterized protein K02A2.6-like [Copidosoma floridanum]|uniref:uncharacterized protein K02A2.6-like n=1 Tax=Copidosoma floridanum TaxID=29053 RepID=UPI0006C94167|nr:uncharacterized protein K02A2.6-like [Copidosoma floridanum]
MVRVTVGDLATGLMASGVHESTDASVRTAWINNLSKQGVIQELNLRELEFDAQSTLDELRKVLVKVVREQAKAPVPVEGTDSATATENEEETEEMAQSEAAKLEFVLSKDDCEIFVERLDIMFMARETKDNKKAAILLTRLDEDAYKLITNLCAPAKPVTKDYAALIKIMGDHLAPKPSQAMERCTFNMAKDQFVCGIRDQETKVALFKVEDLTFEKALKEAQARESAVKNALSSLQTLDGKRTQNNVFKFKATSNSQNRNSNIKADRKSAKCYRCNSEDHNAATSSRPEMKYLGGQEEDKFGKQRDGDDNSSSNESEAEVTPSDKNLYMRDFYVLRKGTFYTVISENFKSKYFPEFQVEQTNNVLYGYNDYAFHVTGELKNLRVRFIGLEKRLNCFFMPGSGPPLIGRKWLEAFGCWPLQNLIDKQRETNQIFKIDNMNVKESITRNFPTLFDSSPGLYNKSKVNLYLKDDAKPIALKARHVPHALKPLIKEEIDRLIRSGHLERVETSEWATPIVSIMKSNGKVRICGDYKLTINPQLIINKYPLHQIDDIFAILQGDEHFSQLDLCHAYMQFAIEDKCKKFLTITTHTGFLQYTKLGEGVASGPGIFQQKIDECRAEKSEFFKDKIEVLGFVIDRDGLHKEKSKVKAMVEAPKPILTKEVASFLGYLFLFAVLKKSSS